MLALVVGIDVCACECIATEHHPGGEEGGRGGATIPGQPTNPCPIPHHPETREDTRPELKFDSVLIRMVSRGDESFG